MPEALSIGIKIDWMERDDARNRIAKAIADVRDEDGGLEYISLATRYAMAERAIGYLTAKLEITP